MVTTSPDHVHPGCVGSPDRTTREVWFSHVPLDTLDGNPVLVHRNYGGRSLTTLHWEEPPVFQLGPGSGGETPDSGVLRVVVSDVLPLLPRLRRGEELVAGRVPDEEAEEVVVHVQQLQDVP